ncbi:uncharacterized protein L969DRAFT_93509 [Mixia osmundae IAM 14324]|uniref:Nop domain-containing protein n=1 Tax=Mixia osmundae (strain CBS 9802 / IAM 14324 / JCM 22182 / KY 12970) TaxID=764103 RepID=G7DU66_MIXOS|nr:uncharacterized protein L969DRAFT_93509 [Mixia osmundae IAM 14324]KEI40993.1 hypothetical protein L969DRAFT_93509 [Mixia osmundae IAM 14324]GAA94126.1 hypothetical protein E5Q_00774 [Mixia osmundae IAM 14324]
MSSLADELLADLDGSDDDAPADDYEAFATNGHVASVNGKGKGRASEDDEEMDERDEQEMKQEDDLLPIPEGGIAPAEELDAEEVEKMQTSTIDSVRQIAKLVSTARFRDTLAQVEQYSAQTPGDMSSSDSPEYRLIVQANNLAVEIDNEILLAYKFARDHYSPRFSELEQLLSDFAPTDYCRAVLAIGNPEDLGTPDLKGVLPSATVMVVTVTATTNAGRQLTAKEWQAVQDACAMIAQLEAARRTIIEHVKSRMSLLAPNLTVLLGTETATKLLGVAGGVTALSKMPACNIHLLGAQRKSASGIATGSHLVQRRHTGFIYASDLVMSQAEEYRVKAQRKIGAKVALAARIDARRQCKDGSFGLKVREDIETKLDKLAEPPPAKLTKALPVPAEGKKKRRGGKRARKAKEAYAMTELRKLQNRQMFGEAEEEDGAFDETKGLGMIGKATGSIRANVADTRTKAKMSKASKNRLSMLRAATSGSQTSGTASSLSFTPHQGLEIIDPTRANRVEEANKKWFAAGSFSHIPSKGSPVQAPQRCIAEMQAHRRLLWDPSGQSERFVVASSSDVKLYELGQERRRQTVKTVAAYSDLAAVRSLAWSYSHPNLIALGMLSGKCILLHMATSQSVEPNTPSTPGQVQLQARASRPCNSVAFCPSDPHLLATGLDKSRDYGLQVWDIETAAGVLQADMDAKAQTRLGAALSEPKPLMQHGPSEACSSVIFLAGSGSPTIVAGMGAKSLRSYDLRAPSTHQQSLVWSTRSVNGLCADPYDNHRFASYGDDNVVKIWDTRWPADSILSFSDDDASDKRKARDVYPARRALEPVKLTAIAFNSSRRGLLASSERDERALRIWNVIDGPASNALVEPQHRKTAAADSEVPVPLNRSRHEIPGLARPLLFSESLTPAFSQPIAAFAFAARTKGKSQTELVSVSRDGQIELVQLVPPMELAWHVSGDLVIARGSQGRLLNRVRVPPAEDEEPHTLDLDISSVMRRRAIAGYGVTNQSMASDTEPDLADMWSWLNHVDRLATTTTTRVRSIEFDYQGILSIVRGIAQGAQIASTPERASPQGRRSESAISVLDDVSRSLRKGEQARAKDAVFAEAVKDYNKLNNVPAFAPAATSRPAQRRLALHMLGADYALDSFEDATKRYEKAGQLEKAAAWTLFSGNTEQAVKILQRSKDPQIKLIAPALAGFLAQKDTLSSSKNAIFRDLCTSISGELDNPFSRAMMAYIANGDWSDILDEQGLPLRDRIAVALRFLSDDELVKMLQHLAKSAVQSGDLEGLVLLGLTPSGFDLLQAYIDRTGDVQTAAIVASYAPHRWQSTRAERWIGAYRRLLNKWKLYAQRAHFDIARGARSRAIAVTRPVVAPPTATRMFVRCNFCNEVVSAGSQSTQTRASETKRPANATERRKVTHCPKCGQSFPKCSICLQDLAVADDSQAHATGDIKAIASAWCYCQTCRHGGHAMHILEWFKRGHKTCPVADCDCACSRMR